MKIIRFKDFKIFKSKFDQETYLRMVFDGVDGTQRFLAFVINQKAQRAGKDDLLSEDLRDYIRAQCMLAEAKEVKDATTSTPANGS